MILSLAGCFDRLLEAPYVLAPGLGEVRSLGPDGKGNLVAATAKGLVRVDGSGDVEVIDPSPVRAVTVQPGGMATLVDGGVRWDGGGVEVPGARDLVGGWDGRLYVQGADGVTAISREGAATVVTGAHGDSLALGPEPEILLVTSRAVRTLEGRVLAEGIGEIRSAATDTRGRVYVAVGSDAVLYRLEEGGPRLVARYLGDVRDMHFGAGGLLATENLYVADGAGQITYLRPP